jgi:hypothetical protein
MSRHGYHPTFGKLRFRPNYFTNGRLSRPSCCLEDVLAKFDLKEYARRGAEARVAELTSELSMIYGAFPDLQAPATAGACRSRRRASTAAGARNGAAAQGTEQASTAPARRRRSKMTAAQRKAVSERMRKYWAGRRSKTAK